ncbi:MAG: cupin [Candidatus Binataceae bacterium]|jgi:mannose-6-phosphate isomerase-like protein (cupin superfamily)
MSEAKAKATRLIENQSVIVTEWLFGPGEATGFHVHQHDYVVVPLSTARLRVVAKDGSSVENELVAGAPYARDAGVAHNVINQNSFEVRFIEIEVKKQG